MTKTFAFAIAIASIAAASALPAHAATRSVDIGISTFADRCVSQGGIFSDANPTFACETATTSVICAFASINQADCEWAGIDNQIAVNRLLGQPQAESLASIGYKKGGFKKPDFPIIWN
jgi:hypothetical protein